MAMLNNQMVYVLLMHQKLYDIKLNLDVHPMR